MYHLLISSILFTSFWELEKRIKEDKRHPGVVMELKKSEVIWDIVRLIRLKVITYNDLSDFSDELQNEVKRILEMSRLFITIQKIYILFNKTFHVIFLPA